jgi:signal transduction histidine kinase/ActR/RegA family two-component response regulator
MSTSAADPAAQQVALWTPTGKDAALTATVLAKVEIESVVCPDLPSVERVMTAGLGVLLVAEEALSAVNLRLLAATLSQQPAWSDLPILLLARYGADSPIVDQALRSLGNVTLLERPVRPATLISTVQAALKARRRQFEVGDHLAEQVRTNAALEESIRQRARVEEALRDADRRKDEFLAILAHELRNPLAPIRNSLHILRLTERRDPATTELCEMIERQVGHLVRLVDDLMEVSRITRGQVELRLEPVEIAQVLEGAAETTRPIVEAAGHQLTMDLPAEPLVVTGDSVRLSQIFANLFNNAAKYMAPGGAITVKATRRGDEAIVSVRDTGVGIAADMLPHIFKMFTQVDRSKRQAQGGLGIGLTLVRTLVELHRGRVEAFSPGLDQGSEFVVTLPLTRASDQARQDSERKNSASLPHHRVLVVDDNQDAGRSLGHLLRILGAEVQVVHDGPAALDLLNSYRPTIVLLDIGMPTMDGYEVARRIRENPQWRDCQLVALTGWGQEEDRRRSSEAGFDHHLVKPADVGMLRSIFASAESGA